MVAGGLGRFLEMGVLGIKWIIAKVGVESEGK